ncbi:hypothetical protein [Cecembia lonarensis]|uniref:Membrane or secreted protein n=1 Tax=Cecembia lonarensis (strain CCUG 58316 / KCTC 22772 / LW9) TaxID=1225176 RepID=K1LB64_CECL9|nr:hypothetical protein [Cecembia lonarensis]EKB49512.1 hypothetical protein B879_01909 [Cecembia lonarensis LW9]
MKKILMLPMLFLAGILQAQIIEGAWKMTHQDGKEMNDKEFIKIYQDGYFAFGAKELGTNKFIGAGGGDFSLEGNVYKETLDFFTMDPEKVGTTTTYNLDRTGERLVISAQIDGKTLVEIWEKIGNRKDDLTGNWVFTGRKSDGEISRSTPGARRTVKILSGGRFQWIAFNSETKEFMGTGGGTYTAENGKYTELITFFSRDDSRVGASLSFDFEIKDGEWHHSGLSSTGNPIYEIWSKYAEAYKPTK